MPTITRPARGICTRDGSRVFRSRTTSTFSPSAATSNATRCGPAWSSGRRLGGGARCGGGCSRLNPTRAAVAVADSPLAELGRKSESAADRTGTGRRASLRAARHSVRRADGDKRGRRASGTGIRLFARAGVRELNPNLRWPAASPVLLCRLSTFVAGGQCASPFTATVLVDIPSGHFEDGRSASLASTSG